MNAEQFEFRHPLTVFDLAAISRAELTYMGGMAQVYAEGYRAEGDLGRAERFDAALAEIRRRLETV